MKKLFFLLPLFFICSILNGPDDIDFSKMEVHFKKSGGWIDTSELDIYNTGLVEARNINHSGGEITNGKSMMLNDSEKKKVSDLFRSFPDYKRHYEPDPWYTDGNYYAVIFIHKNKPDTVSVYGLNDTDFPGSLEDIIKEMEKLWNKTLGYVPFSPE